MIILTGSNRVKKIVKGKGHKKAARGKFQPEKSVDLNIYAQRVEKKAYELFEKRGCQNGYDWDDWFKAEKIVEAEMIAGK